MPIARECTGAGGQCSTIVGDRFDRGERDRHRKKEMRDEIETSAVSPNSPRLLRTPS